MKKNTLIINTGGTISSTLGSNGYAPKPGMVESLLRKTPALKHPSLPNFNIIEYKPLLDSSNLQVSDWNQIGRDLQLNYDTYDGFIILHGTDTLAYTASALSFMLENLSKPVILTGSQIPLSSPRNDAIDNLITSLYLSAEDSLNEVCVLFNQKLFRGNRTQKVSAQNFNAFNSPNFPCLAKIGIDIQLHHALLLPPSGAPFHYQAITPSFIANFRLFPGFSTDLLSFLLEKPIKGLVLETYGSGNAQTNDAKFLSVLEKAIKKGVVVVNCTQCQHGTVQMQQYETGSALRDIGLVSGWDMTPEAAHCKLLYLFSKYQDTQKIKHLTEASLCGELSRS